MINTVLVFIGGMAGALIRYEVSNRWNSKNRLPWGTIVANFTGGIFLGGLIRLNQAIGFPEWLWGLAAAGFCGGYTTYSTFSYEALGFAREKRWGKAILYILGMTTITLSGVILLLSL